MVTLFVRHKVKDYSVLKAAYDAFGATRQKMGVVGATVFKDGSDSSVVIVTHPFNDLGAAVAFAASSELKSTMQNAGVASAPELWFGEEIEHTAN